MGVARPRRRALPTRAGPPGSPSESLRGVRSLRREDAGGHAPRPRQSVGAAPAPTLSPTPQAARTGLAGDAASGPRRDVDRSRGGLGDSRRDSESGLRRAGPRPDRRCSVASGSAVGTDGSTEDSPGASTSSAFASESGCGTLQPFGAVFETGCRFSRPLSRRTSDVLSTPPVWRSRPRVPQSTAGRSLGGGRSRRTCRAHAAFAVRWRWR
jgi:hypothetical protein